MRVKRTKFKKIKNLAVAVSLTTVLFATACSNGIPTVNNKAIEGISSNTVQNQLEAVVRLVQVKGKDVFTFNTKNYDGYSLILLDDKENLVKTADVSLNKEGKLTLIKGLSYKLILKNKSNDAIVAQTQVFEALSGMSLELTVETTEESSLVSIPVTIREVRKENSAKESIDFSGGVVSPTPTPTATASPTSTPVTPIPIKNPFLIVLNEYQGSDGIRDIPKKDFIFLDLNNGNIIKNIKNPTNSDLNGVSLNSAGDFIFQPASLSYSIGSNIYSNPISVGFKDEALQEFGEIQQEQPYHYLYPINDRVEKRKVNPEVWITSEIFIANNNIYQIKDHTSHELFELTEEEFNRIEGSNGGGGDVNRNHQVVAVYNRNISLFGINREINNLYYFGDFKSVTNPRFQANSDDKVLFIEKVLEKWSLNRISTTTASNTTQLLDISSLTSLKPKRITFEYDLYNNVLFFIHDGLHTEVISFNLGSNSVIFSKVYQYKNLLPTRVFFNNGSFKMNNNNKVIDFFEKSYQQPISSDNIYSQSGQTYSNQAGTQTYVPGGQRSY